MVYIPINLQTNLSITEYLQRIGYKYRHWLSEINKYKTYITTIINSKGEEVPNFLQPNQSIAFNYKTVFGSILNLYSAEALLMQQILSTIDETSVDVVVYGHPFVVSYASYDVSKYSDFLNLYKERCYESEQGQQLHPINHHGDYIYFGVYSQVENAYPAPWEWAGFEYYDNLLRDWSRIHPRATKYLGMYLHGGAWKVHVWAVGMIAVYNDLDEKFRWELPSPYYYEKGAINIINEGKINIIMDIDTVASEE